MTKSKKLIPDQKWKKERENLKRRLETLQKNLLQVRNSPLLTAYETVSLGMLATEFTAVLERWENSNTISKGMFLREKEKEE